MELQAQKSFFRIRGKLVGENGKNFFVKDKTQTGKDYNKSQFGVKTSPTNTIFCEIFGTVQDFAYAYNRKKKDTMKLEWTKRSNPLPDGYNLITPGYDLAQDIKNTYHDGDDVVVTGEIDFQEYEGKTVEHMNVKSIYPATEAVNFDVENFEEDNEFKQDIVFIDKDYDKDLDKIFVIAYTLKSNGKKKPPTVQGCNFVLNPNESEKIKHLSTKFMKDFKPGDVMTIGGRILNKVELVESNEDNGWGESVGMVKQSTKELEIRGVDPKTYISKMYKIEDLDNAKHTVIVEGKMPWEVEE